VLNIVGRACIAAGVLILLFVAYQLWGTGIREAQAQNRLEKQFKDRLATTTTTVTTVTTAPPSSSNSDTINTLPPVTAPPNPTPVAEGQALGQIQIPKIGLDAIVVEGVGDDDLKSGPGHYPSTPEPGQKGNAAIAGHRTTYGAPFGSIDELQPDDVITITTVQGKFTYAVMKQDDGSGHIIVGPDQVEVLNEIPGKNTLTLTACHPKYSASERIIVFAQLKGEPKPTPPPAAGTGTGTEKTSAPTLNTESLSGKKAAKLPTILFALLCAAIWIVAWQLGQRWKKWPSYALGLPFFLVALFYFFENFSRLLPSNF
jgi:sortase A